MSKVMSTQTVIGSDAGAAFAEERPSFFRRPLPPLMAAREEQARRYLSSHLANYSDEQLASLGLTEAEMKSLREHAGICPPYWL
jgi:hypothetical protein